MTSLHSLAAAAVWLALGTAASFAHAAEKPGALPNPAGADAIVPATRYQSALAYSPAVADNTSPAQNWKALNQQVGANDSMALTMGGVPEPQPAAVTPETGQATTATPAQPPAIAHDGHAGHAPAAAPAPDPHAHHKKKEAP